MVDFIYYYIELAGNLQNEKPDAERKENKHGMPDNLKSTLLFSGVVIAVVGAILAVLKKIKEA